MEDEAGVEQAAAADATTAPTTEPAKPEPTPRSDLGAFAQHERRLRRLMGRTTAYPGRIDVVTRCWVSRDGGMHMFAARFLDFAVLTPDHLYLCSTGFFSRHPRRRVFREPISRLVVVPRGPEPQHILRIRGDFENPLLFEMRNTPEGNAFARELIERTRLPDPPKRPAVEDTAP
jgi:hypothetical protein